MQKIGPKFPKLAEIPRFLCRCQEIGHFLKILISLTILGIGFQILHLRPMLHGLYKVFSHYGSKITFSKTKTNLEGILSHKLAAQECPPNKYL